MTLIQILESRRTALTVHEVAELFEVSKQHIYEMVADGSLPAFQVGRSVRFDPQGLADWLRKKKPPVADPAGRERGPNKKEANSNRKRNGEGLKKTASVYPIWRKKIDHVEAAAAIDGAAIEDMDSPKP